MCGNKITTEVFVERAIALNGSDKYDYSLVDYRCMTSPITIVCPIHGQFSQRPVDHLAGNGCSSCAKGGFKTRLDGYVYVLKIDGIFSFVGYGITNLPEKRLYRHKLELARNGCFIEEVFVSDKIIGKLAKDAEDDLNSVFEKPRFNIDVSGFRRESTCEPFGNVVKHLMNYIEQHKEPQ